MNKSHQNTLIFSTGFTQILSTMKKTGTFFAIATLLLLASACNKKPDFNYYYYTAEETALLGQYLDLPDLPHDYSVEFPAHLRSAGLFPRGVERDKAVLGRVLFYDKQLSKDGTVSCASCHKQDIGFSDDKAVSPGVYGRLGERNAIALASVANFSAYYGTDLNGSLAIRFFWDNRAETAAEQNRGSLTNPLEMDMHMDDVVVAVENQPYYQPLFRKAYGDVSVTADRVNESIANFINAMGSFQSKFDEHVFGAGYSFDYSRNFSGFTPQENNGKSIYMQVCASCHSTNMGRPVLFYANNGLDAGLTSDLGVGGITGADHEKGVFKVPTLRNIALTAPYMHDGRFQTLEEVVEHYNSGIQNHPNLHYDLRAGGQPMRMNLSNSAKQDLIAFLHTLTDDKIRVDERFANPFK